MTYYIAYCIFTCGFSFTDAPSYSGESGYTAPEGTSDFTIQLNIEAFPIGNISWYFNGNRLSEDESLMLSVSSITFTTVDRRHAGTYRVQSTNLVGSGELEFQFIIHCRS